MKMAVVDDVEVYKNRLQQVTNLNTTIFQALPILATVTGGLWYFATQNLKEKPLFSIGVFVFAALVNLAGAMLVRRMGAYLHARLTDMENREGAVFKDGAGRETVNVWGLHTATLIALVLWCATAISAAGAYFTCYPLK
jgi:hypothetical protein